MLSINLLMAEVRHRLRNRLSIVNTTKLLFPPKFWWQTSSQYFLMFKNNGLDNGLVFDEPPICPEKTCFPLFASQKSINWFVFVHFD